MAVRRSLFSGAAPTATSTAPAPRSAFYSGVRTVASGLALVVAIPLAIPVLLIGSIASAALSLLDANDAQTEDEDEESRFEEVDDD